MTILAMAAKMSAMIISFAYLISIASALPADASALESALSALVNEITTLESRSQFWEKSLPWFTGLVVLGLAGGWQALPRGTGPHLSTIETRGVPHPFLP
jgi:hypothetical protein